MWQFKIGSGRGAIASKWSTGMVILAGIMLALKPAIGVAATAPPLETARLVMTSRGPADDLIQPIASQEFDSDDFSGGSQGTVAIAINQASNLALAQILTGTLPLPPAGLAAGVSAADYIVAQRNVANLQALSRLSQEKLAQVAVTPTPVELQDLLTTASLNPVQAAQITRTIFLLRAIATTAGLSVDQTATATLAFVRILSGQPITATDLQRAIATYDRVVDSANLEFLQNPPAEFQVLQSALRSILNAGIRAAQTDSDRAREH